MDAESQQLVSQLSGSRRINTKSSCLIYSRVELIRCAIVSSESECSV